MVGGSPHHEELYQRVTALGSLRATVRGKWKGQCRYFHLQWLCVLLCVYESEKEFFLRQERVTL